MLEINPNCGVYYLPKDAGSADLCLLHDPEGHAGFTRQLIRAALHRHQQRADHNVRPMRTVSQQPEVAAPISF
jgi:D-alanine-D-alanine ligase